MSGPFDDLVPQQGGGGGAFDDLVLQKSLKLPPRPIGAAMSANNPPLPQVGPGPRTTAMPTPSKPWADVPGEALRNLPASAGNFLSSLVQPILHPIDTATALGRVGEGVVSKGRALARGAVGLPVDVDRPTVEGPANALGQFYADRYGSVEGLKNTLATDPVGSLADASLVLAPGVTLPGRAGQIAGTVSRAIDPVTQSVNALRVGGRGIAAAASHGLGMTTGAGADVVRLAANAGRQGGPAAETFTANMRGHTPVQEVVDAARDAVTQMRAERGAEYRAGMADVGQDATVLNFQRIDNAVNRAAEVGEFRGQTGRGAPQTVEPHAVDRVNEMRDTVAQWQALDPAEFHTPLGLDALKRRLGNIRDATELHSPERTAADRIYNAVRAEVAGQVPEYARAMEDYQRASEGINEATRTFSLGERASGDTAARKLLSATRNNVQTNYGERIRLLNALAEHSPELPYAIAGQGMNAALPRGLVARLAAMGAAPVNALALPAFSPRLVGEAAYYAGRGGGLAEEAMNFLRLNEQNARRGGRAAYQSGRAQEAQ